MLEKDKPGLIKPIDLICCSNALRNISNGFFSIVE